MPTKKTVSASVEIISQKKAIEMIGFRDAKGKEKGIPYAHPQGPRKYVLDKNKTNRPFKPKLAVLYSEQMLKGEWSGQWNSPSSTCNGESLVIDSKGNVASAAHRLTALILAEFERQRLENIGADEKIVEFGCKKPITIESVVVKNTDPRAADTNDTGKGRDLGDVLFRKNLFKGEKDIPETAQQMLSKQLSGAIRLVWLRINGNRVARGPKLLHPEAVDFLKQHPLIKDCLLNCYHANGGGGADGQKISRYITLGYAAALMYLMGYSASQRKSLEEGSLDMTRKPKNWGAAEDFWELFANDMHSDDNPIRALHKSLEKNNSSKDDKLSRDALCTLVVRSWLSYTEEVDKWSTTASLGRGLYRKEDGESILVFERIGGFDLDRDALVEAGWLDTNEAVIRTSSESWTVGDTCWVNDPNDEAWFGSIVAFDDSGNVAEVQLKDSEETYLCELSWLCTEKPEVEEESDVEESEETAE